MSLIPIIIVAYLFGGVAYLADHASIGVPVAVIAWLLLFLPWERLDGKHVAQALESSIRPARVPAPQHP